MDVRIKYHGIDITLDENKKLQSELEKVLLIRPNSQIIENAKRFDKKVDQIDIIIEHINENQFKYRIDYTYNEEGKKCFLGSQDYDSQSLNE